MVTGNCTWQGRHRLPVSRQDHRVRISRSDSPKYEYIFLPTYTIIQRKIYVTLWAMSSSIANSMHIEAGSISIDGGHRFRYTTFYVSQVGVWSGYLVGTYKTNVRIKNALKNEDRGRKTRARASSQSRPRPRNEIQSLTRMNLHTFLMASEANRLSTHKHDISIKGQ